MVPGLGHCFGGPGANSFGGPGQSSVSQGGAGQSLSFTPQDDMILATIDWVEKGVTPKSLIGVKYKNDNLAQGAAFTRLFCPYPQVPIIYIIKLYNTNKLFQEAIYRGGDVNKASSYSCGLPA